MKKKSISNRLLKQWPVLLTASLLAAGALVHLVRIFYPFTIMFGGTVVPQWGSYLGLAVAGLLSGFLFWSALRKVRF